MSDIINIIALTLFVNILSTLIAFIIGIILGYSLYFSKNKFKKLFINFNKVMMGLPPVVLGLILFIVFKRDGALGFMHILYTPLILIIAQVLLIIPIITGNVYSMLTIRGKKLFFTLKMYHVNNIKLVYYSIFEFKQQLLFIFTIGFSRAVSEVGAILIVGGNIKGSTRMMTTALATLRSQGDYNSAIILGIILLVISFLIHIILNIFEVKTNENI